MDLEINARMIRCYYRGCEPPPKPMTLRDMPSHKEYWSDPNTWLNFTADSLPPQDYDDLIIPIDKYIIVDQALPKFGTVVIDGGLEFSVNNTMDIEMEAEYILITGRLIAGWDDANPYTANLVIRLRGNHSTPTYPSNGVALGTKFIGVFGGLQLHGESRGVTKTYLASTVDSGNQITVTDIVTWVAGDEILITTTDYNPWHTEVFSISSVSGNTITLNSTIQHRHIAHTESVNGQDITLSAVVALLTRNIKIEGEEYEDMISESFGARVIVGQLFIGGETHSGFGQISNVEFYHSGQEGFFENYDPRFSLVFMDTTSDPNDIRYSYVRNNTFHNGFNTAIGVFAIDNLEVDGNVVHHTVGQGIRTEATGTIITNNLVALCIWDGSYLDRFEPVNMRYPGGIDGLLATNLILNNNIVAGSERWGFSVGGQACDTSPSDLWSNNVAQGCLIGTGVWYLDPAGDPDCVTFNGFTLWKNLDFGLYYIHNPSIKIQNNIFVENGVGIMPFVMGPSSISHSVGNKISQVLNNVFIGKTSTFSESLDRIDGSDDNIRGSSMARGAGSNKVCGKIGLLMTIFTSSGNGIPSHPLTGIMGYQTINGKTEIDGNTFVNWGSCTGGRDSIIATSPSNDDGNHPVYIVSSSFINTEENSKIYFHPPNVGKINSADCVDMDCDAMKKCMIKDDDGTFIGHIGTVLPDSAYEWDGDRRHGLGDYRIPTVMKTTSDGGMIDMNSYAPNKGIYKTDNCTWIEAWRAYKCEDHYDWRMLVIESMDEDTETRRISPVAVYSPEGYIDLINGPQDHGWCSGYTCRKRLSTFQAIVALDQPFDLFLSSTNPKTMRYMLLGSEANECVRLGMYYINQNRLEVHVDGVYKQPNNGYTDNNGRFRLRPQTTNNEFMPDVNNKVNGENFLSRAESMLFWVQCGGDSLITIETKDVFIVSFTLPAMSDTEFFGEQIVENLAGFLDIDPSKVRIVNIVEDTSNNGRRKRSANTVTFEVEIADQPGDNSTTTVNNEDVGQRIVNQAQLSPDGFDSILNASVLYVAVREPSSNPDNEGDLVTLQRVGYIVWETAPGGDVSENQPLRTQPKIKITDQSNNVVSYLGSVSEDWEIQATIKSGGSRRSRLLGNVTVTFQNGWANFTNLAITNRGDYILEFTITKPANASNFTLDSLNIHVNGRNVAPKAEVKTLQRLSNRPIEVELSLEDLDDLTSISDITWANHTWTAVASILDARYYDGTLLGTTSVTFDENTGLANFYDLQLSKPGKAPVLFTISSDPPDYPRLEKVVLMTLKTPEQANMVVEKTTTLEIKFDMDFDATLSEYYAAQVCTQYSQSNDLICTDASARQGSMYISLNIEGTFTGYNGTVTDLCDQIENSTTYTFGNTTVNLASYMTVDGQQYYGVECGVIPTTSSSPVDEDSDLETVYIIIIVILSTIVLVLLAVLLAYKVYFHPKAKTSNWNSEGHQYTNSSHNGDLLDDALFREDTFNSFKSGPLNRPLTSSMAPVGTNMTSQSPFSVDIKTPGRELTTTPVPRLFTPSPASPAATGLQDILNAQNSNTAPPMQPTNVQPNWDFDKQ